MPPLSSLRPSRRLFRAASVLIPLGVAANVAVALATTDRHLLGALDGPAREALLVAAGLSLVPWLTQSLRIAVWTRFVGHPVSVLSGLRIYAGGVLGSAVTPTAVGGGSIRWALATRRGLPPGKAASLLAVEAVEDVVFFALALPAAALLSAGSELRAFRRATSGAAADGSAALVAAGVAGAVLLAAGLAHLALRGALGRRPRQRGLRLAARVRRPLRAAWADARLVAALVARRGKRWFALSLSLTAVQWLARYSVATAVIVVLGGPLRPFLFWVLGWMTYAVSSVVPTPGGAGAAETTFYLLHRPFVPAAVLVAATAAWRLLLFYLPVALAVVAWPALEAVERRGGPACEPVAENAPRAEPTGAPPLPSAPVSLPSPDG